MGDDATFIEAYARLRRQYDTETWLLLSRREIADAIHRQMRAIDAERQRGEGRRSPRNGDASGLSGQSGRVVTGDQG